MSGPHVEIIDQMHVRTAGGRLLEFLTNQDPIADHREADQFPELANEWGNRAAVEAELIRQGVVETPKVKAEDIHGKELPGVRALYVDREIGAARVRGVMERLEGMLAEPEGSAQTQRKVTGRKLKGMVSKALDESGVEVPTIR